MGTKASKATKTATPNTGNAADRDYDAFLARFQKCYNAIEAPLFRTDASGLWETYLDAFPTARERQHHDCHACRDFIRTYGNLVTIDPTSGLTSPVFWDENEATPLYRLAFQALARAVRRARVKGVFLTATSLWGKPITGPWRHLSVVARPPHLYASRVLEPSQRAAEKREEYITVSNALAEWGPAVLDEAVRVLDSDALYRSAKVLGQATWLRDLHVTRAQAKNKENITWLAVAEAPSGFCHPRASMIATLLDDIASGLDFATVSSRFSAKMHPLRYQRPQAAPTRGAIETAEKLVEQLGIAPALARRFCRLDEVEATWSPRPETATPQQGKGVFSRLVARHDLPVSHLALPAETMTLAKFERTLLPAADRIDLRAPTWGNYCQFVTATHADAPPILQWDRPDARNPVSWYVYHGGSSALQWGLVASEWIPVETITIGPWAWRGGIVAHFGEARVFLLRGALDSKSRELALFPENLRTELHGVRAVIEAYSKSQQLAPCDGPSAAGILFSYRNDPRATVHLRVWTQGHAREIVLDRWE